MIIWRCSVHASLNGEGGMYASARWHTIGHRLTYCSPNSSGALLEVLANLKGKAEVLPRNLQYLVIDLPDAIDRERLNSKSLPADWRKRESLTRSLGDEWLASVRTAVLEVPSVLSPETDNFLLNPLHRQASGIKIARTIKHPLDSRLVADFGGSTSRK